MCKSFCVSKLLTSRSRSTHRSRRRRSSSRSRSSSSSRRRRGGGGGLNSDEAKMCGERTKEQVQAKNRNKYKTRTNRRTTPHNQTHRQAGGFPFTAGRSFHLQSWSSDHRLPVRVSGHLALRKVEKKLSVFTAGLGTSFASYGLGPEAHQIA